MTPHFRSDKLTLLLYVGSYTKWQYILETPGSKLSCSERIDEVSGWGRIKIWCELGKGGGNDDARECHRHPTLTLMFTLALTLPYPYSHRYHPSTYPSTYPYP